MTRVLDLLRCWSISVRSALVDTQIATSTSVFGIDNHRDHHYGSDEVYEPLATCSPSHVSRACCCRWAPLASLRLGVLCRCWLESRSAGAVAAAAAADVDGDDDDDDDHHDDSTPFTALRERTALPQPLSQQAVAAWASSESAVGGAHSGKPLRRHQHQ